jgi:hypothetical protein
VLQVSVANRALSKTVLVIGEVPARTMGKKAAVGLVRVCTPLAGNVLEVY